MKVKRYHVFKLEKWIMENGNKKGGGFKYYYGLDKNLKIVTSETSSSRKELKDQIEYENSCAALVNKFKEDIKALESNTFPKPEEKEEATKTLSEKLNTDLTVLQEEYKAKGTFDATDKLMNEDVEIEFYLIDKDVFPVDCINSLDEITLLSPIIKED
jgi:hypothetical protein